MHLREPLPVGFDGKFLFQLPQRGAQDFFAAGGQLPETVMHPFAVPPGLDQPGPFQVREVPGDFRLVGLQDGLQIAHADFPLFHQVKQPEAAFIGQRREEQGEITHAHIYGLTYSCASPRLNMHKRI